MLTACGTERRTGEIYKAEEVRALAGALGPGPDDSPYLRARGLHEKTGIL